MTLPNLKTSWWKVGRPQLDAFKMPLRKTTAIRLMIRPHVFSRSILGKKTFRILEVNGWPFLERLLPKVGKTISGFDRWMVSLPHSQWDVPGVPFIFTTITAMVKPLPPLDEILVFYRKSLLAKPPAGTRNRRVTCMLLVASSSSSVGENSSNKASLGIWWLLGLWFTLVGAKCHFQDP